MMLWFSLLVLIPLCAVVATAGENGWGTFLDALQNEQTANALKLTVAQLARRHRRQHRDGHDHRLGAGP